MPCKSNTLHILSDGVMLQLHCKQVAVGLKALDERIDFAFADPVTFGKYGHDIRNFFAFGKQPVIVIIELDILYVIYPDAYILTGF